jgi:hypothetical protein
LTPNGQPDYNKFNWDKIANEMVEMDEIKNTTATIFYNFRSINFIAVPDNNKRFLI